MQADSYFLLAGAVLLLAVSLPTALHRFAVSPAMVLVVVGALIGLTPLADGLVVDVTDEGSLLLVEHVTEVTVLCALMGVGLAIDRPLHLLRLDSWRRWSPTWRLLAVTLPVSVGVVAVLGWWALGLAPASALLLGAVLSPTDPVLASDVQVGGPGSSIADDEPDDIPYDQDPTTITEAGEVRFALTSEAGLNDGLAFPFVNGALLILAGGSLAGGMVEFVAWELIGKVVIGVVVGIVVGRLLGAVVFRSNRPSLRLAEQGEPLLALAALLATYGVAELAHGYGFLAVFACGMALRSAEHRAEYHRAMHDVISRLERLLTLAVLLALGIAFSGGLFADLDWRGIAVGLLLVFVIRPAAGLLALGIAPRRDPYAGGLGQRARVIVACFGVRGVGSIFYLAYATSHGTFEDTPWLWSTVAFTIALSVVVHGVAATPLMRRLEGEPSGNAAG